MREIDNPNKIFTVELTLAEATLIRELTQNSHEHWTVDQSKTALSLFVGASRLLGYRMNDNGTIIRDNGFWG